MSLSLHGVSLGKAGFELGQIALGFTGYEKHRFYGADKILCFLKNYEPRDFDSFYSDLMTFGNENLTSVLNRKRQAKNLFKKHQNKRLLQKTLTNLDFFEKGLIEALLFADENKTKLFNSLIKGANK